MAESTFTLRETSVAAADEARDHVDELIQAIKEWDLAGAIMSLEQLYADLIGLTEAIGALWLGDIGPDVVVPVDTPDELAVRILERLERHGVAAKGVASADA